MKKLFTFFALMAGVSTQAQLANSTELRSALAARRVSVPHDPRFASHSNSVSRASTDTIFLDYFSSDDYIATRDGYERTAYVWDLNSHLRTSDTFSLKFMTVEFDSLLLNLSSDGSTVSALSFFPRATSTLTLQSFFTYVRHTHVSASTDTLKFTVYDLANRTFTGSGVNSDVSVGTPLWDTTYYLTSELPADPNLNGLVPLEMFPNVTLPQGHSFGIRLDYAADTVNHLTVLASYNDACDGQAGAVASVVPDNTIAYLNFGSFSGFVNNLTLGNPSQTACYRFPLQNGYIFPTVQVVSDYGTRIVADKTIGCPGDVIPLDINLFGTNETSATFAWSVLSGDGTLDNTDGETNAITLGQNNTRVLLSATTADGTVSDTVTFQSRSINVTFNTNPYTLQCGNGATSVTLTPTVTGTTTGRTNSWSGPFTTAPTSNNATANYPGTYTLQVTNSTGCTASASVVVQYPGGISNNVDFVRPNNGAALCVGVQYTFENTSEKKGDASGWASRWEYGDGEETDAIVDGVHTYASSATGTRTIKLTMDSAGCVFSKTRSQSVTTCTGINDLAFEGSISMMPNPTSANVTIEVADVEKNVSVVFYNILGAAVKSFATEANGQFSKTFNVADFASGTYIVKIASGNKVATKRLVVSK